jgi:hypothetical protein
MAQLSGFVPKGKDDLRRAVSEQERKPQKTEKKEDTKNTGGR